jgi:hypothetical protein
MTISTHLKNRFFFLNKKLLVGRHSSSSLKNQSTKAGLPTKYKASLQNPNLIVYGGKTWLVLQSGLVGLLYIRSKIVEIHLFPAQRIRFFQFFFEVWIYKLFWFVFYIKNLKLKLKNLYKVNWFVNKKIINNKLEELIDKCRLKYLIL